MTYAHLSTDERILIEAYFHQEVPVLQIAGRIHRSRQTVHKVVSFLKEGRNILDCLRQYRKNKKRCGRQRIHLPKEQRDYVKKKVAAGWTPDVIIALKPEGQKATHIEKALDQWFRHIPRKSLQYQTPVEAFLSYVNKSILSN